MDGRDRPAASISGSIERRHFLGLLGVSAGSLDCLALLLQTGDDWDAAQLAHHIPTFPDQDSLGGLQTDLDSRVLGADGAPVPGLYAAGEVADFGGGGVHGYSALEGTFLGGCIFSGRAAGRDAAKQAK